MSGLLHQTVPVWQLLVLVTFYVIYKELVKLGVKLTYKRLRSEADARRQRRALLGSATDEVPQCAAASEVQRPLELDDQRPHPDTGDRT